MLSSLSIENIAVIKKANIDFGSGFNVLTGETGAGKSILIDSINLIIGAKPSRDLIRNGESEATVSALFTEASIPLSGLDDSDITPDEDDNVYITRQIDSEGKAKTRINGRTVPVSLQRTLAERLVSIHGQNDNRILMSASAHLQYLDSYAENKGLYDEYYSVYLELTEYKKKLSELYVDDREKARKTELLKYQIADIDGAKLKAGEEEELQAQKKRLRDAERIMKQSRLVTKALYRNDRSLPAYELIKKAITAIEGISEYFENAEQYIEKLSEMTYILEEIGLCAEDISGEEYSDPDKEIDRIESRLDLINKLQRKYGTDIAEILEYRERAAKELSEIELADELILELEDKIKKAEKRAQLLGEKLSLSRKEAARVLEGSVVSELSYLEMPKVRFKVDIKRSLTPEGKVKFLKTGIDEIEFLLSANPGEPLKPLAKIASGGELSRIMLALKSVNSRDEKGQTLIFDEIDTGVSGKTSQKIGMKLRALSKNNQVICVTHSAQIAAEAHHQFLIKKTESNGRVMTTVEELDREGRINEIARIMGGVNITSKLLDSAAEMLDSANK